MLYPLLLQAHKDVRFQPWLRGAIQGIQPQDMAKLFTGTDKMKPGVLKHISLDRKSVVFRSQAHKDVRFQPWLRGAIQGIQPQDMAKLFTGTDKMKPGVLKHISLHGAMDQRYSKCKI